MTADTNPNPSAAIVVLGMHRSGTSMVAGALCRAGAWAGDPADLLADQDDNPLGFWERRDVVALNEALLEGQGAHWYQPSSALVEWPSFDAEPKRNDSSTDANTPPSDPIGLTLRESAADTTSLLAAIKSHAPAGAALLLKDPRLSLTWPAWSAALPDAHCVFVYRTPMAVARSLNRRNHFPMLLGFALWEIYNAASLAILRERGGIAVSFDAIQRDPAGQLDALIAALMARGVDLDPGAARQAYAEGQPKTGPDPEPDTRLTPAQCELAALCRELCADGVAEVSAASVPSLPEPADAAALAADVGASLAPLAVARETELALEDARSHTVERDQAIAQLHSTEAEYQSLVMLHEAQVAAHAELTAANDELHAEFRDLASQLKTQVAEKAEVVEALTAREAAFTELADAHEAERARHATLIEAHSNLVGQHRALEAEYLARGEELNRFADDLDRARVTLDQTRVALDASNSRITELEHDLAALNDKADWLFDTLVQDYGNLIAFEMSFLGRLGRLTRRGYRLITFRRGRSTAYEDTLAAAHTFFRDHDIPLPPEKPSKRRQVAAMARYTAANPVSSLRSMSLPRLRKVVSVVREAPAEDLQVWVDARFPDPAPKATPAPIAAPDADEALVFPTVDAPVVSIIVPAFNEFAVTHRCLASVLAHTRGAYEVIVADDCSTDATADIGAHIVGITHIRPETNQRFLRNCNHAASAARGDFLLFLNNDTTVTEGWLDALLATFDDPTVGIAGPKLLFPDGKLQEAGGIVWKDASGWNFGRADDPARPQFNYLRETDYVSGAALMIRRSLWTALGGFDDAFAPAYYEDTDLCFQARAAGYRVVYQPAAEVVHYEGVTNGTDLASGQKQYQVVNADKFRHKWREELEARHFPNAEHVVWARDRSRDQRSVLVIDHYVPHWDKDAGSRSTFMYLQLLVNAGYRVQFLGANFFPHQPYTEALQQLGIEVLVGESMARNLDRWLRENLPYVDHILLHRPHIAEQMLPHLKKQKVRPPITYIGHDLHFLRTRREAALTGDDRRLKEAAQWQKREFAVFRQVDHVVYFSEAEAAEVRAIDSEQPVHTIPLYILDPIDTPVVPTEHPELLFVAGFNHPPNIDAAIWLVEAILPLVRATAPDVHLHIAGSNPNSQVLALGGAAITVHGYVTDDELAALYARAACAVVPLRFGAGVKGKVLEAIQRGVPLVTTPVGAEGIPDAGSVMHIAETAEAFAAAVVAALASAPDANVRGDWMAQHFSRSRALAELGHLIGPPRRAT